MFNKIKPDKEDEELLDKLPHKTYCSKLEKTLNEEDLKNGCCDKGIPIQMEEVYLDPTWLFVCKECSNRIVFPEKYRKVFGVKRGE